MGTNVKRSVSSESWTVGLARVPCYSYRALWCRWNKRQISNWSSEGYLKRVQCYNWFRFHISRKCRIMQSSRISVAIFCIKLYFGALLFNMVLFWCKCLFYFICVPKRDSSWEAFLLLFPPKFWQLSGQCAFLQTFVEQITDDLPE